MKLVDRLRRRSDSLYGSEHEELRGLLNMAAERIEVAEMMEAWSHHVPCLSRESGGVASMVPSARHLSSGIRHDVNCPGCRYNKLVREQEGE